MTISEKAREVEAELCHRALGTPVAKVIQRLIDEVRAESPTRLADSAWLASMGEVYERMPLSKYIAVGGLRYGCAAWLARRYVKGALTESAKLMRKGEADRSLTDSKG